MTTLLLVMTDGRRDCIQRSMATMGRLKGGDITRRIIHDDSGNTGYRRWLTDMWRDWEVHATSARVGFSGAYHAAWTLAADGGTDYVFSTEDDFEFTRDLDLDQMAQVLTSHPHLTQLALRRQPWNHTEKQAGGIVEMHPDAYTDHGVGDAQWLEHREFVTTNPSLLRREFIAEHLPWPVGPNSEGRFSIGVFAADPDARSGFWGSRDSGEWCRHVGVERVGTGY